MFCIEHRVVDTRPEHDSSTLQALSSSALASQCCLRQPQGGRQHVSSSPRPIDFQHTRHHDLPRAGNPMGSTDALILSESQAQACLSPQLCSKNARLHATDETGECNGDDTNHKKVPFRKYCQLKCCKTVVPAVHTGARSFGELERFVTRELPGEAQDYGDREQVSAISELERDAAAVSLADDSMLDGLTQGQTKVARVGRVRDQNGNHLTRSGPDKHGLVPCCGSESCTCCNRVAENAMRPGQLGSALDRDGHPLLQPSMAVTKEPQAHYAEDHRGIASETDSVLCESTTGSTTDLLASFYACGQGFGNTNRGYETDSESRTDVETSKEPGTEVLRRNLRDGAKKRRQVCRTTRASAPASCDSKVLADDRPEVPPRLPIPPLPAKRNGYSRWSAEVSSYMWPKECPSGVGKVLLRESLSWGGDADRLPRIPLLEATESNPSSPCKTRLRESLSWGCESERFPPAHFMCDSPLLRDSSRSPPQTFQDRPPRVPPRGGCSSEAGAWGSDSEEGERMIRTRHSPSWVCEGEFPPRLPPREPMSPPLSRTPSPKGFMPAVPPSVSLSSSPQSGTRPMPPTQSFASDPKFATVGLGKEKTCCLASRGPCILPIIKDGKKQSNTHYYLLPERPAYLDRYERFFRESDTEDKDQGLVVAETRPGAENCDDAVLGCHSDANLVQDKIRQVLESVHGVTTEESQTALQAHGRDVPQAVHYLKVEQLFRLSIATRPECQRVLEHFSGNLERASSHLLESCTLATHRH
uniref:uncharacterized protein isoform X2 n=1 Tax=Myxine glutinosa TaxID=7769 RepID=UPI00358FA71F